MEDCVYDVTVCQYGKKDGFIVLRATYKEYLALLDLVMHNSSTDITISTDPMPSSARLKVEGE